MLKIIDLSKRFGKKEVLKHLSLELNQGIYGLLGANGAGKTTLLRTLSCIYPIQSGEILFDGQSITHDPAYHRCVGYLPQSFGMFPNFTVWEMMRYFALLKEIPKAEQEAAIRHSLEMVNLLDCSKQKVSKLSGGMVRRLGIAQAFLGSPRLVILDEPTTGLDPEERSRFKKLLSTLPKNVIVLLCTHIVADVEAVCDRIILLDHGEIVDDGTPEEIRSIAAGHVYLVPSSMESKLQEPFEITKQEQFRGVEYLRVLSPVCQQGETEEPTIEDGYLYRKKWS